MTRKHQKDFLSSIKKNNIINNFYFTSNTDRDHGSYHQTIKVSKNNEIIGFLHVNQNSKYGSDFSLFEFENEFLYRKTRSKIIDLIRELELHVGIKVNNINKLDISYDTSEHLFNKFIMLKPIKGVKNLGPYLSSRFINSLYVNDFRDGVLGGDGKYATLKMYSKTSEILEKSKKYYIPDYWRDNGLIPDEYEINRFEVSLKTRYFRRNHGNLSPFEIIENFETILNSFQLRQFKISGKKDHLPFLQIDLSLINNQIFNDSISNTEIPHFSSDQYHMTYVSVFKQAVHTWLDCESIPSHNLIEYCIYSPEISFNVLATAIDQHRGRGKQVDERKLYLMEMFEDRKRIISLEYQYRQKRSKLD